MIDYLEEVRWKYHMEYWLPKVQPYRGLIPKMWWIEHGAFVSVLPRQSGKTRLIKKLTSNLNEPFKIVVPSLSMIDNYRRYKGVHAITIQDLLADVSGIGDLPFNINDIHIFVDEYQRLKQSELDFLFSYHWKSVSLFGTLGHKNG